MSADLQSVPRLRTLPDGWRWVKLKDIGPLTDGDWILNMDYTPSGVRLLQVGDVGVGEFVGKSSRFITMDRAKELGCTFLQAGDVLISRMPDPMGRACLLPDLGYSSITAVDVSIWRPKQEIADREFVTHYLNSLEWFARVMKEASGATRSRISRSNLENLEIPLPPLAEQKRIAGILKEQMAAVERARRSVEAQLQAAEALPAAHLRAVFSSPEAQSWPRKRLGEVLELRQEVVHPRDDPSGAATFVGLEHIQSGTGVRTGSVAMEMSELTGRKPRFYKGDIVYGYLRPYLNKVWLAEFDGLCSVDQYVYKVDATKADTTFVSSFMRSPVYLQRAPIGLTQSQLPRIRTEEVASVELNFPPLSDQRRIASELSTQMSSAERLRQTLAEQLDAINKLPAALLREAFSGRV